MNINNIENIEKTPENIWETIFNKQGRLAKRYSKIEDMKDLLITVENNLDTAYGQSWIKDFAWRVTEELTEAEEAAILYVKKQEPDCLIHYYEELIDALHFLVELSIVAGYNWEIVYNCKLKLKDHEQKSEWQDVVYYLGLMCNCLKNKPWKQTHMLTDRSKFKSYLRFTWAHFLKILEKHEMPEENIYNLYFKKNAVNKFRIRSKY